MKINHSVAGKLFVAILCVCLCVVPSFGPRLSTAFGAIAGPVTATDVIAPLETDESTSTVQTKNILSVMELSVFAINDLRFNLRVFPLSGINNTTFQFYDYIEEAQPALSFADTTDGDGKLTVTYDPTNPDIGVPFLFCGYNTTDDVALAKRAIRYTVEYGEVSEDIYVGPGDEFVLTQTQVLMGDVDNNNVIDDGDRDLLILARNDSSVLTQYQFLAADLNMDGTLDAQDSMLLSQYLQGGIVSFWEIDGLVSQPLSSTIQNNTNYKFNFKNKGNGNYLITDDENYTVMRAASYSDETSALDINVEVGLFVIQNPLNDCYLSVDRYDNLYEATFSYFPVNQSQYWYITEKDGNYYIVNFAYPDRVLSGDLTLKRCLHNAKWEITRQTVNINYYYDNCYSARFSNNLVATTSSIVQYQDDIQAIFADVFGLAVTTSFPQLMQSYSDTCYNDAITMGNVDNKCNHAGGDTEDGNNDCVAFHSVNTNSPPPPSSEEIHHNNSRANLYYLRQQKQSPTPVDIQFLMSGHFACGKGTSGTNHIYNNVGGLANRGYRVAVVFNTSPNSDYYRFFSVVHEISHCLGAGSARGSKADIDMGVDHPNCVMAYKNDQIELKEAWAEGNYDDLFCSFCKAEMANYILLNY